MGNDIIRLIDANAVLKEMRTSGRAAYMIVEEAPTINPDSLIPKGRWVKDTDGDEYCENCSRDMPDREITGDPSAHNYCPNCGAKMMED